MRVPKFAFVILLCLGSTLALGQDADPTGKIFPSIGDYVANRDLVLERYAMLATGETVLQELDAIPIVKPFYAIRVEDRSSGYRYRAWASSQAGSAKGIGGESRIVNPRTIQGWQEDGRFDGKRKMRSGFINSNNYRLFGPGIDPANERERGGFIPLYFDPFDDIVMFGCFFTHIELNRGSAELIFLRSANLDRTEKGIHGLISHWTLRKGDFNLAIEMVHDVEHDFFPKRISYRSLEAKGLLKDYFVETMVDWKRLDGCIVPVRINHICTTFGGRSPGRNEQRLDCVIDWLVGDDAPDDLFDFEAEDLRAGVMKHFDVKFDRIVNGVKVQGDPIEPTRELLIEMD